MNLNGYRHVASRQWRITWSLLAAIAIPCTASNATTILIPTDQPTIQAGVAAAINGDEVVLLDGVYSGAGNVNVTFGGKLIIVRSANGPDNCTIDCQHTARAFIIRNNETSAARIEGITIINGEGISDGALAMPTSGGAIYIQNAGPSIANCRIMNSHASNGGGILAATSFGTGALNVSGCALNNNTATTNGGGIYAFNLPSTISDCTFVDNQGSDGGAVYAKNDSLMLIMLSGCTFSSSFSAGSARGVYLNKANATLIDCDYGNCGMHAFDTRIILSNCTFTGGAGTPAALIDTFGLVGGINPVLTNCSFINNPGGGLRCENLPATTLVDCTFDANGGTGFHAIGGTNTLNHCTLNGHDSGRAVQAGSGTTLRFNDCAIRDNAGGGIMVQSSATVRLNRCTIADNHSGSGAGVFQDGGGSVTAVDCIFSNNTATTGGSPTGGAVFVQNGTGRFFNCLFVGNSAGLDGGAMYILSTVPATIANCVFNNNSAQRGGGIAGIGARITLSNSTLVNNTATSQGGAMYNHLGGISPLVQNSILRNNSPTFIVDDNNAPTTVQYCDIQGGWGGPGGNNFDAEPLFVDADGADNTAGTVDDDLHLNRSSSPCIDAGSNSLIATDQADLDADANVTEPCPRDFDGRSRITDNPVVTNTGSGSPAIVDIGPYESCGVNLSHPGDVDLNDLVNIDDLVKVITTWGPCPTSCCPADVNLDWIINIDDLAIVIGHWGM